MKLDRLDVSVHTIPTDGPESDGTFEWDSTTIVVVEARAGGEVGVGYTYTHAAAAELIRDRLAPLVETVEPRLAYTRMAAALRNICRPGLGMKTRRAGSGR